MKKLNFEKLMAENPTEYSRIKNQLDQEIIFVEHPFEGEDYPVIAVFPQEKIAACTDFYDTGDFYENSEYLPMFKDGVVDCASNFGF